MTTRSHTFLKIALPLLAAMALSGCLHHRGTMMDHHMHHTAKHDARLGELLDTMNAAEGAAKVDAMAAVVNELARRRGWAHGCPHKAHAAQGCGCPLCPHASEPCPMDSAK